MDEVYPRHLTLPGLSRSNALEMGLPYSQIVPIVLNYRSAMLQLHVARVIKFVVWLVVGVITKVALTLIVFLV